MYQNGFVPRGAGECVLSLPIGEEEGEGLYEGAFEGEGKTAIKL